MDISKITSFPWADPVAVCSQLLPGKCCHTFLDDFNFTDEQCIKTSLSKFIGMGIIIGSTLVKMPQVIKISKAKSSVGISFWGVLLELMAITFNTAYSFQRGYPFSAWGEALFILIETGIIAFLVLWYTPNRSGALAFLLSISSTIYILTFGLTPINILWYLQACNLPLAVTGKLLQAYRNWQNGHTGQLSALTCWMLSLGCVARVFTTLQETGDQLVLFTFIGAAMANFVLVAQVHYYWQATSRFLSKKQKSS